SAEVVVEKDADPGSDLRVTGRFMYGDHHEMYAVNEKSHQREIYEYGDAVDDGILIAAHPRGGVVYMEKTNHYYLYPIGRMFPDRILLEGVKTREAVGAAIDALNQKKEGSVVLTNQPAGTVSK